MIPLHPKLVHFPIALMYTAMILQGIGYVFKKEQFRSSAWLIFVLAVITMPVVVISGLWEADRLHLHHPVLDEHRQYAFLALWTTLASGAILGFLKLRYKIFSQALFLGILVGICVLLTLTAHEGGEMVYQYGVGVTP